MDTRRYDDCRDLFAALSEYLDAELPAADCAAIEKHIADCPPCVEFVNSLRKTVALCRTPMEPVGPPAVTAEVRARLLSAYRASMEGDS